MIHDVTIAARDGGRLAASVFAPNGPPRGVVLINSATAVPRKIYRGFAGYLAERGLVAVTYDYRGIGGSRRASFADVDVRMRDWANSTSPARSITRERRGQPCRAIVGHSFGGQALGLIDNNREISRALLVAAQAAYWE
jgi:predicted alpha/beta hydrolase